MFFTFRLHIIDVISCPVWLLVLLLQTGYIQVQQSWYDVIFSTANMLTCAVCLGINRNRRNTANMSMTRFVHLNPLYNMVHYIMVLDITQISAEPKTVTIV